MPVFFIGPFLLARFYFYNEFSHTHLVSGEVMETGAQQVSSAFGAFFFARKSLYRGNIFGGEFLGKMFAPLKVWSKFGGFEFNKKNLTAYIPKREKKFEFSFVYF